MKIIGPRVLILAGILALACSLFAAEDSAKQPPPDKAPPKYVRKSAAPGEAPQGEDAPKAEPEKAPPKESKGEPAKPDSATGKAPAGAQAKDEKTGKEGTPPAEGSRSYIREPATATKKGEKPKGPRLAVFPFGNQTVSHGIDYLEQGLRQLLQGLAEKNPGLDLVTEDGLDRAIRRHGLNPDHYVPLTELQAIAAELGCDFALGGFLSDLQTQVALHGVLVRVPKAAKKTDLFVWPLQAVLKDSTEAEAGARGFWQDAAALMGIGAGQQEAGFLTGHRLKVRVITDADRALISLSDPGAVELSGVSFRVIEGRQVSEVSMRPSLGGGPGEITVANQHPEGSRRRCVVDIHLVADTEEKELRLRADKDGPGTLKLEFYNENRINEPHLAKTVNVDESTTSTEFTMPMEPFTRQGPVFVLVREFGPEAGSVPLAKPPSTPTKPTPSEEPGAEPGKAEPGKAEPGKAEPGKAEPGKPGTGTEKNGKGPKPSPG